MRLGELDHDLTRQHDGEPIGERIIVAGRVLDGEGRRSRNTLVEVWQANAARPLRAPRDQHPAPLDPNFSGAGRCLTDDEGRYRFVTIKPGAYPWGNHYNAWRPAHIHFSLLGRAFAQRLVTQMYFPGDPLFAVRPDLQLDPTTPRPRAADLALRDPRARSPTGRSRYAFDIVLRGPGATPFEEALMIHGLTPSQTVGPFFAIGLPWPEGPHAVAPGTPGRDHDPRHALDGAGEPVPDSLIETWQADPDGRFADAWGTAAVELEGFRGFARSATRTATALRDRDGQAGAGAAAPAARSQAPHLDVSVFARGLLHRFVTRIYFADEEAPTRPTRSSRPCPPTGARRCSRSRSTTATDSTSGCRASGETVFFDV